jgi:hypothetical protein
VTTTAAEVRGHFGWHWAAGPFTRGHLGRLWEAEPLVPGVQPVIAAPLARWAARSVGVAPLREPRVAIEGLVDRVERYARSPELKKWTGAALTRASAAGADLTTDEGLAAAWLEGARAARLAPLEEAVLVAAGFVALGLPTAVVVRGSRALAAVYANGQWRYADPGLPLGESRPHAGAEEVRRVPDLPAPEVAELRREVQELRAAVAAQQAEIAWLRAALVEATSAIDQQVRSLTLEPAPALTRVERRVDWLAVVLVGAAVGAALWAVTSLPRSSRTRASRRSAGRRTGGRRLRASRASSGSRGARRSS